MPKLRQLAVLFIPVFCLAAPAAKYFVSEAQAAPAIPANAPIKAAPASAVSPASSMSQASKPVPPSAATPPSATPKMNAASAPAATGSMSLLSSNGKVATRPATALPGQDEFYDPANPDYSKLQKANESLAGFTLDKKEYVNWMNVLRANLISPRADIAGKGKMEVLDLDIIMKNTKSMPFVKFPHNSHTMWLSCSNCHEQIFVKKAGANQIDMTKIFRGQYCGVCHDKVAFSMFFSCETCHSVPQKGDKAWWK